MIILLLLDKLPRIYLIKTLKLLSKLPKNIFTVWSNSREYLHAFYQIDLYYFVQEQSYIANNRGSPLSTIFGTWKKSYNAKFEHVEQHIKSTD